MPLRRAQRHGAYLRAQRVMRRARYAYISESDHATALYSHERHYTADMRLLRRHAAAAAYLPLFFA